MPKALDPIIETASLEQLQESLAKFKRANKAQKQQLGGSRYKKQLEAKITSIETASEHNGSGREPTLNHDELSDHEHGPPEGPISAQQAPANGIVRTQLQQVTAMGTMEVDPEPKSIEMLVETLPYIPLEKFKVAWNAFRISGPSSAGSTHALETAWQALQTVATVTCQALGIPMGDPAWVGLPDNSANGTIENITATAEWLSNWIPSFDEIGAQGPNQAPERTFQAWDYMKGAYIDVTDARMLEARTNPSAHIGCIEEGADIILRILTNRNKNQKCLSCEAGGRGHSVSSKGQALRGDGSGFLNKCHCPFDTALTEFWMYKVMADDPQVPACNDANIPPSDFALNPVSLWLIGAVIKAASGLSTEDLFDACHDRLETTILWVMTEMISDCFTEEHLNKVKSVKGCFVKTMTVLRELDQVDN